MPRQSGPLSLGGVQLNGRQHFPEAGRRVPSSCWQLTKALPSREEPPPHPGRMAGGHPPGTGAHFLFSSYPMNMPPARAGRTAILHKGQSLALGNNGLLQTRMSAGVQSDPVRGPS